MERNGIEWNDGMKPTNIETRLEELDTWSLFQEEEEVPRRK